MKLTWDRGTLLLRGPGPGASLPGALWDARVDAWRAPAYLHESVVRELRGAGLDVEDGVLAPQAELACGREQSLRPYQEAALVAWWAGGRRGMVVLPTGAGKTRTAIAAIARCGVPTLCLVPTRVLLDQWREALSAAGFATLGRYGDGDHVDGPLTVATYASAARYMDRLGNRFGLLVVDEAHHFGSTTGDEALEMCTAPSRLGLTATPVGEPARAERLAAILGPVVYRASIGELAGRFLAPFTVSTISLPLTPGERALYDADLARWRPVVRQFFAHAPGASWPDFVAAAQHSDAGRAALAAWRRSRSLVRWTERKRSTLGLLLERHAASRVLVFTADAVTAYAVAVEHLVPVITADIGREERLAVLGRFSRGEVRVLASARVLNEGVDVPEADVAVIIGGAQGDREYVQRVGRVLRPAPGKEATVYELVTLGTHEVAAADRRRGALA